MASRSRVRIEKVWVDGALKEVTVDIVDIEEKLTEIKKKINKLPNGIYPEKTKLRNEEKELGRLIAERQKFFDSFGHQAPSNAGCDEIEKLIETLKNESVEKEIRDTDFHSNMLLILFVVIFFYSMYVYGVIKALIGLFIFSIIIGIINRLSGNAPPAKSTHDLSTLRNKRTCVYKNGIC